MAPLFYCSQIPGTQNDLRVQEWSPTSHVGVDGILTPSIWRWDPHL